MLSVAVGSEEVMPEKCLDVADSELTCRGHSILAVLTPSAGTGVKS